jgi:hypothetical protein
LLGFAASRDRSPLSGGGNRRCPILDSSHEFGDVSPGHRAELELKSMTNGPNEASRDLIVISADSISRRAESCGAAPDSSIWDVMT